MFRKQCSADFEMSLASSGEVEGTHCVAQEQLGDPISHRGASIWEVLAATQVARPWRVQGYFSGLGEDRSLCPLGALACDTILCGGPILWNLGEGTQTPRLPKTNPKDRSAPAEHSPWGQH